MFFDQVPYIGAASQWRIFWPQSSFFDQALVSAQSCRNRFSILILDETARNDLAIRWSLENIFVCTATNI